jgi:hypothetical protein
MSGTYGTFKIATRGCHPIFFLKKSLKIKKNFFLKKIWQPHVAILIVPRVAEVKIRQFWMNVLFLSFLIAVAQIPPLVWTCKKKKKKCTTYETKQN